MISSLPVLAVFIDIFVCGVHSHFNDHDRHLMLREADFLKKFSCNFGVGSDISLCSWGVEQSAHKTIRWKVGQGTFSHWSGGPPTDHSCKNASGGFAYFETSYKSPSSKGLDVLSVRSWLKNMTIQDHGQKLEERLQPVLTRLQALNERLHSKLQPRPILLNVQNIYRYAIRDFVIPSSSVLQSSLITGTRPQGVCFTFYYMISGLSADRLSITILEPGSGRSRLLWQSRLESVDEWMRMELSYAHPSDHLLLITGVAKNSTDIEREYRGYIAIDDITFVPMGYDDSCYGHCTFDGGLCGWRNDGEMDDFDWRLSKGSSSLYTGPSQDFNSFARDLPPGNFLFIDASYPLRFGDRAELISPDFPATSKAKGFCMKFAYHMFGDGIGNLSVIIRRMSDPPNQLVWKMAGDQGNVWHHAQVPVYSSEPFNLIIEATVGPAPLGNIAIDAIYMFEEFCATSPSAASIRIGDCTFEDSLCDWSNKQHVDDFDWVRVPHVASGSSFRAARRLEDEMNRNQTSISYYLTLNGDMLRPDKAGLSARLQSPQFPAHFDQCMTFNYFMYQNTSKDAVKDPSLGGVRVYLQEVNGEPGNTIDHLVWRLSNHQSNKWRRARIPMKILDPISRKLTAPIRPYHVLFEGIWANARDGVVGIDDVGFTSGECHLSPDYAAASSLAECTFDKTTCGWTPYQIRSPHLKNVWYPWKLVVPATAVDASSFLRDHTFNIPVGYVSFTAPGSDEPVKGAILSPILSSRDEEMRVQASPYKCVSFWFKAFPGKDNLPSRKTLSLFQAVLFPRLEVDAKSLLLWHISDHQVPDKGWSYGQVTVKSELSYRLLFKVDARAGGFAIDDVSFSDGSCQSESPLLSLTIISHFSSQLVHSLPKYKRGIRTRVSIPYICNFLSQS